MELNASCKKIMKKQQITLLEKKTQGSSHRKGDLGPGEQVEKDWRGKEFLSRRDHGSKDTLAHNPAKCR